MELGLEMFPVHSASEPMTLISSKDIGKVIGAFTGMEVTFI